MIIKESNFPITLVVSKSLPTFECHVENVPRIFGDLSGPEIFTNLIFDKQKNSILEENHQGTISKSIPNHVFA